MIRYEGQLYRPPSEADSLILQATIGCSYNRCTFCAMYRDKRFRVRPIAEVREEIEWARREYGPRVRKVFLADGDALVAKASFQLEILAALRDAFRSCAGCRATRRPSRCRCGNRQSCSPCGSGLTQLYLGVESGHDEVLEALDKGVDAGQMVAAAAKATAAGMKLSTMILLGAGGRALSLEHARASAEVIGRIAPRFVSTLVMTPVEGTPLMEDAERGLVDELDPVELAAELLEFLRHLRVRGTIFRSNHASNFLALKGTLPKDQGALVRFLEGVLERPDRAPFVPDALRAL